MCLHTPSVTGIVIDCKRNLKQRQRTLYKNILSVHILQVKIGCTPVRLTWEDHLLSLFHSEEFDEQASITSLPVLIMSSQLLFADSLTSTLLDWLGWSTAPLPRFQKNTGLTVLAFPHFHLTRLRDGDPSRTGLTILVYPHCRLTQLKMSWLARWTSLRKT